MKLSQSYEHLRAFCWLRWRLLANQLTRGGLLNRILLVMFVIMGVFIAIGAFLGAFAAGSLLFLLPELPPVVLLLVWDGLILAFLFSWSLGVLTELQRSEAFSLDKFLHLPVSLSGVFVLNYLTSLFSFNLAIFVPILAGFTLGLVFSKGPLMILVFPLLAAFVWMITALTYQLQGWLATLMANKRRRRTIIVMITLVFVVISQSPNLINVFKPWTQFDEEAKNVNREINALAQELSKKTISQEEFNQKSEKILHDVQERNKQRGRRALELSEEIAWSGSLVLPPGWLALGAWYAAEGNALPAVLGTLGMGLIGGVSVWRSYRTTLRFYQGQQNAGVRAPASETAIPAAATVARPAAFFEMRLPGLSEQTAAIALASFRSILRAPETKMLILSPIICLAIFGGVLVHKPQNVPEYVRPLPGFGMMALILFTMIQLVGNQFGFDRSGFRLFVLCPSPRRDILLGKNLAIAPIALGLALPMVALGQVVMPMRLDLLVALPIQFLSMFLLYCMVANVMSILVPIPVAAGTLKPVNPKMLQILLGALFMSLVPLVLLPTLVPLGLEAALYHLAGLEGVPICLMLTILECVGVVFLYRLVLSGEGRLLQAREKKILETVTAKAE